MTLFPIQYSFSLITGKKLETIVRIFSTFELIKTANLQKIHPVKRVSIFPVQDICFLYGIYNADTRTYF